MKQKISPRKFAYVVSEVGTKLAFGESVFVHTVTEKYAHTNKGRLDLNRLSQTAPRGLAKEEPKIIGNQFELYRYFSNKRRMTLQRKYGVGLLNFRRRYD